MVTFIVVEMIIYMITAFLAPNKTISEAEEFAIVFFMLNKYAVFVAIFITAIHML